MAIEFDLLAGKKLRTDLAIKAAVKLDTPEAAAAPTGGGTKIGLDPKVITSIAGHACTTSVLFFCRMLITGGSAYFIAQSLRS